MSEEEKEIRRGIHYSRLESDLSKAKTDHVLAVLDRPEILDALERRPLREIVIRRLTEKDISAFYIYDDRSITINSARKLGVHFGEDFRPGVTVNMSAATTDKTESMRRALLQEIAHHMEGIVEAGELMRSGFANPGKRPITKYAADAGWREYFAESLVAHVVDAGALENYDPGGSMMVKAVLSAVRKLTP
jgi:hypothetical protein